MKKFFLLLLALGIIAIAVVFSLNTGVSRTLARLPRQESSDFKQLTYRIYLFGLIPVGEARLSNNGAEDLQGREVIHLSGTAATASYLSSLLKGRLSVDSYIDNATLYPLLFTQTLRISGRPDDVKQIVYDQEAGIMIVGGTQREIVSGVQDPLSAILNLTRMDFDKANGIIGMDVNSSQRTYALEGTISQERRIIKNVSHRIVTVTTSVRRKDKNPYHTSRMTFVLSKQHAFTPILIKVFAGGVFITAQLIDFQ
jgi:hypothetical protein